MRPLTPSPLPPPRTTGTTTTTLPVTMMPNNNNKNNHNTHDVNVPQLKLKEYPTSTKLSWLSGYDLWNLRSIPPPPPPRTSTTSLMKTRMQPKTSLRLSDGPHGIRKPLSDLSITQSYPATCFPSACALACSWNTDLLEHQVASTLRDECLYYDIHILLGPGVNLKRHPFGGRNHEYFSEDPYLTGHLAKAFIQGIQQQEEEEQQHDGIEDEGKQPAGQSQEQKKKRRVPGRVAACLKHFALNNQESYRMIINVICDERTIRELYLPAFEICLSSEYYSDAASESDSVNDGESDNDIDHSTSTSTSNSKNQQQQNHNHNHKHIHNPPKLVMGAYNKVNGLYCCEHTWLLQTILREEWKFDEGVVVSDWGAINNRLASIKAGCDLEMPGCPKQNQGVFDTEIIKAMASARAIHDEVDSSGSDGDDGNGNGDGDGDGGEGNEIKTAIDKCATRVVQLIADYSSSSTSSSTSSLLSSSSNTEDGGVDDDDNNNDDDNDNEDVDVDVRKRRKMFEKHHQIARKVAQECIVLLQNQNQLLPLSIEDYTHQESTTTKTTTTTTTDDSDNKRKRRVKRLAVIGEFGKQAPRIQGMGSAHVTSTQITSVYDALQSLLVLNNHNHNTTLDTTSIEIPFARGYDADADVEEEDTNNGIDQGLIDEAVEMVTRTTTTETDMDTTDTTDTGTVDTILICIGLPEIMESEGFDRTSLKLPTQHIQLVEALLRACQNDGSKKKNVIIILSHGGIVEIPQSFIADDSTNQNNGCNISIVDGYLLGQAGGQAIIDILFGMVSPSGKLSETIPLSAEDIPSGPYFPGRSQDTVEYREGFDVGYRYYNTPQLLSSSSSDDDNDTNSNAIPMIPVRYSFGYGLTYTEFEYRNLTIQIRHDTPTHKRVGVSFELYNRGHTHTNTRFHQSVQEVIQVYIRPISSAVYRPYHELKEFCKVDVPWQDCRTVHLELPQRAFALYDIGRHKWIVEHQKKKRVPSKDDRGNVTANNKEEDDDDDNECMEVEVVEYEIQIGSSSRDIRLRQTIQFQTGHMTSTLARESYPPKTTVPTTTTCTTNTTTNNNNNDSTSSTTRSFLVEDDVFAKRFIGGAVGVGGGVGVGGNDTDKRSDSSTSSSTSTSRSRMNITSTTTGSRNSRSIPLVQVITRNTLLVDASSLSWIGSLLLFISLKVAQLELHKDDTTTTTTTTTNESSSSQSSSTTTTTTTKKRELRLIRANVENLPLRGLVLFSQGAFTFKWLDFLVCLMNGYYWKGIKSIFFSFTLFRSNEKKKKKKKN